MHATNKCTKDHTVAKHGIISELVSKFNFENFYFIATYIAEKLSWVSHNTINY